MEVLLSHGMHPVLKSQKKSGKIVVMLIQWVLSGGVQWIRFVEFKML